MFPRIRTIHDVLPYIKDDPAFRVVEKPTGHTFINYNHMGLDVFPDFPSDEAWERAKNDAWENHCLYQDMECAQIRRECRGIAFDTTTGKIVSRPFHKFFNLGERSEVDPENLNWSARHVIMEKLDGSMIRPLPVNGGFRWGTKMGVTDVALLAEEYVVRHENYTELARACQKSGRTPIFEYTSPHNRIVVDYPGECLTLLAVRDNVLGTYFSYENLETVAAGYKVPLVRVYDSKDSTAYLDSVRTSTDHDEGVVVWWKDAAVKVKTEEYVRLHKVKDGLSSERRVAQLILDETLDDLLALLDKEERARYEEYTTSFYNALNSMAADVKLWYALVRSKHGTKKDFALASYAKAYERMRPLVFALWDGRDLNEVTLRVISSAVSNETKWQEMKKTWGFDTSWDSMGVTNVDD